MCVYVRVCACVRASACVCFIQGDLGGKVNILGGDNTDHCVQKVLPNMCVILNGHRVRAV